MTTANDIVQTTTNTRTVVTNLKDTLDRTNEAIDNSRSEYSASTLVKQGMLQEIDKLQKSFLEGISLTLSRHMVLT